MTVSIYDPVIAALDSVRARILTNLKDLGDDPSAVERVTPMPRARGCRARRRLRGRGGARRFGAQAEAVRRDRAEGAARHDPGQQHLGDPDHQDHGGAQGPLARARHPLVESAVPCAAGRGDRNAMDLAARDRLDHGAAPGSRKDARPREEGRAGLRRQPAAACPVARGDRAGRARHLRRRDRRHRDQVELRPASRGARAAGECRSRRHRSHPGDPSDRAA